MPDYSVIFPLQTSGENIGYKAISKKNLEDLAAFNLKNIILTDPGERIMEPLFGVGIKRYLFEQITDNKQLRIKNEIRSQVERYAPYIDITSIDTAPEDNVLSITIKYEVATAEIAGELVLVVAP